MASYDIAKLLEELEQAKAPLSFNPNWSAEESYNYIVHMYDVFILLPAWQWEAESRSYFPKGIRMTSGPYKGHFPSNGPK